MTARAAGTLALNAAVIGWAVAGRAVGVTSPPPAGPLASGGG